MSESLAPSNSRVAMSVAFKRARRKFPTNFGVMSKGEEAYETSKQKLCQKLNSDEERTHVGALEVISTSNQVESSLIDSLEAVGISEKTEISSDCCEQYPGKFDSVDQEIVSSLTLDENSKHNFDTMHHSNEFTITQTFYDGNPTFSLNWKEESDQCENMDSDVEVPRIHDVQEQFYERRSESSSSRRKAQRKSKKTSTHSASSRRSYDSHFAPKHRCYDDDGVLHSPHCSYYNRCHRQHCHRHCCCRAHCCHCSCCYSCREQCLGSAHDFEPTPYCRRPSSHQRQKIERCSACGRRCSGTSKTPNSQRMETCSRDSGIFTGARCDNDEDYDDDLSNNLEHKDSLCLIQNKLRSESGKRGVRSNNRSEQTDGASADDDKPELARKSKRKLCRRLFDRSSNSY